MEIVIFHFMMPSKNEVVFHTRSGELTVTRKGDLLEMDFPALPPEPCEVPEPLLRAFQKAPLEVLASDDYLVLFPEEKDILDLAPDFSALGEVDRRGVIVTAEGEQTDFVSRFFAPKFGIPEDPVTGSAHCALTPYWADKLHKSRLTARQVSKRSGYIECELKGDRVFLSGKAVKYMEGKIDI